MELYLERGCYAMSFLGKTMLVYHNPDRKDTFGSSSVSVVDIELEDHEGEVVSISGASLCGEHAVLLRDGFYRRVDMHLK